MEIFLVSLGVHIATTLSWLPDKLDIANAMVLGAGVGAAFGGAIGLLPGIQAKAPQLAAAAAIVFLVLAALAVLIEIVFGEHGHHPVLFP